MDGKFIEKCALSGLIPSNELLLEIVRDVPGSTLPVCPAMYIFIVWRQETIRR